MSSLAVREQLDTSLRIKGRVLIPGNGLNTHAALTKGNNLSYTNINAKPMSDMGSYLFKESCDVIHFIVDDKPCVLAHIMCPYFL